MKYFKMNEFQCKDGCEMPASAQENIKALVEQVLDPIREQLGKPIMVNSGYRCPRHNLRVGGAVNSQHMKGEAADIRLAEMADNAEIVSAIKENGEWDQMIVYPVFVHVSWKKAGGNRKEILKKTAKGYEKVSAFKL